MPFQNLENFCLPENELLNHISLDSPINYLNSYNLNNNNINLQQDSLTDFTSNIDNNISDNDDFDLGNTKNSIPNFVNGISMLSYNMNEESTLGNSLSQSSFSSSSDSLSSLIDNDRIDNNASPISEENDTLTSDKNKILTSSININTTAFYDDNFDSKVTFEFPQKFQDNSTNDFLTPVSSITLSCDDLLFQNNLIFSSNNAGVSPSSLVVEEESATNEKKAKRTRKNKKAVSKKKVKKSVHSHTIASIANNLKKVSDSRLSAQGLAQVLHLDSPEEALQREKYILQIFEEDLHYPLGYKTWIRDTEKEERTELINELYDRVKGRYPDYNQEILETIIRRATYYMMQSRLRRERRAKNKSKEQSK
ncbi:hypothetical protein C6P45_002270 [Maudiozyma exigua]|uniref:Uncharacterized protein n=1 Tax=Maudiozyma exigua TaxID=34358 RepID=A0A9P6WF03_MAUEX|nr:hypothetical protein C6P45_002270 [Kazachstania exigua]